MTYSSLNSFIDKISKTDLNEEEALDRISHKAQDNIRARHGKYPTDYHWEKLKPQTIAQKKSGDTPLLETGELKNSYKIQRKKGERVVYSDIDKAVWMEYGVAMKNIPARPVVEPEARQAEIYTDQEFNKVLDDYINKL